MQKYTLRTLLDPWVKVEPKQDCVVSHLSTDTRHIQAGDIFFALQGCQQDGRAFIQQAVAKGAVAVLCEQQNKAESIARLTDVSGQEIPIFFIDKLREKVGEIAAKFYDYPSKKLTVIGATGTNGKTSCTQWIAKALSQLQVTCGVMGTLGYGFPEKLNSTEYTTPFAIDIQRILADLYTGGARAVAMEVSSHGLEQHRVAGVEFNQAIFTNLTHDHLDYHGNLQDYAAAKKRLFTFPSLQHSIFNLDDTYGQAWFLEYKNQKIPPRCARPPFSKGVDTLLTQQHQPCYGYSLNPDIDQLFSKEFLIYASHFSLSEKGIEATVISPWGEGLLKSPLLGRFNLSNLLAVLTSLCLMGIAFKDVLAIMPLLNSSPGRMQVLSEKGKPTVVIDYSHTPDSLLQALKSLREHCGNKLWCVFGCGGDRDKTKRPIMGKIAEQYADYVVITDDNSRHEDPKSIVADILSGLSLDSTAVIEHNRRQAILHAITHADSRDIVLIAGKGHECYQQIGDEKIPFSDAVEAQLILNQR